MSIDKYIDQKIDNARKQDIEELRKEMRTMLSEIEKMVAKPLSRKEAANLLNCAEKTFDAHRHLIPVAGGTEKKPLFWRNDVLSLREKIRAKYD